MSNSLAAPILRCGGREDLTDLKIARQKTDCFNLDNKIMGALPPDRGPGMNQHYEYAKPNVDLHSIVEVVSNLIPPAAICSKLHNLSAFQKKKPNAQTITCELLATRSTLSRTIETCT
jgi:hypothetical protein